MMMMMMMNLRARPSKLAFAIRPANTPAPADASSALEAIVQSSALTVAHKPEKRGPRHTVDKWMRQANGWIMLAEVNH